MEEKIRYRPVSVRDLLTELWTITMLMIDLAYSSILFDDNELAEEVLVLEERVDNLKTLLLMNTAIVIRDAEDAESMVGIMRMGTAADRISEAAGDIARTGLLGIGVDPSVREAFRRTQERLVRTRVLPESILRGKNLGELRLEANIGVNIIAMRTDKDLTTNPGADRMIFEGDIIIARGSDVGVIELDRLAKGELREIPRPRLDLEEAH